MAQTTGTDNTVLAKNAWWRKTNAAMMSNYCRLVGVLSNLPGCMGVSPHVGVHFYCAILSSLPVPAGRRPDQL